MKLRTTLLVASLFAFLAISAQAQISEQDHQDHHPEGAEQPRQETPKAPETQGSSQMRMQQMMKNMPENCGGMSQGAQMNCMMMQDKAKTRSPMNK